MGDVAWEETTCIVTELSLGGDVSQQVKGAGLVLLVGCWSSEDALPETLALENILLQGHAAGEKKNVGHSYKTGSSVWGCGYTEKDLAAMV